MNLTVRCSSDFALHHQRWSISSTEAEYVALYSSNVIMWIHKLFSEFSHFLVIHAYNIKGLIRLSYLFGHTKFTSDVHFHLFDKQLLLVAVKVGRLSHDSGCDYRMITYQKS